jgi:Xaa-Pro aminopeptidase
LFAIDNITEKTPEAWIEANLSAGATLAYNPWLHTVSAAEKLAKACEAAGGKLVPAAPLDAIWRDRPPAPLGQVSLHDLRFAGEPAEAKLNRARAEIERLKADALVVSDPCALAWTFNIRGTDVAHTPLVLGFATIPKGGWPAV